MDVTWVVVGGGRLSMSAGEEAQTEDVVTDENDGDHRRRRCASRQHIEMSRRVEASRWCAVRVRPIMRADADAQTGYVAVSTEPALIARRRGAAERPVMH